ncbi:MAG: hypothetical protein CYPHOPRED_002581 [Cyphobasidiales sp. Tagirdzhanova-0007]|nr:MAG: hypothetical protein CYPHOPRED_002581 [Cyphobasidiales sp. Tagirdzhanova-0007]
MITPMTSTASQLADTAVAWYISAHITSGHIFLANNWQPGDKICLLEEHTQHLYKKTDKGSRKLAKQFKKTFSRTVCVDFVGVWDTVSSVGAIVSRHFPYATASETIRVFRQAISLDEHRVKFRQNRWHATPPSRKAGVLDPEAVWLPDEDVNLDSANRSPHDSILSDAQEVYFAGCHTGVGGGDCDNDVAIQLSNIPLLETSFPLDILLFTDIMVISDWMIKKAKAADVGIVFDDEALTAFLVSFNGSVFTTNEGRQVNRNIQAKILDNLWNFTTFKTATKTIFWWSLEFVPFPRSYQNSRTKHWHRSYAPHLFRARAVAPGSMVHRSVQDKMNLEGYRPRAKLPADIVWVDE